MPQDVVTRWNSTYTMLKFSLTYGDCVNGLVVGDLRQAH
jgi:hypothetical protein